jgi:hypothetical protein
MHVNRGSDREYLVLAAFVALAPACAGSAGNGTPTNDSFLGRRSSSGSSGAGNDGAASVGTLATSGSTPAPYMGGNGGSGTIATPCMGACCTPPTLGAPCAATNEGTTCPGDGLCPGGLLFPWEVVCQGGTWQPKGEGCPNLEGGVTEGGCPAQQPSPGAPCTSLDAGGVVPGVPVCPPGGPAAGSADAGGDILCALPLVLSCQYELECGPSAGACEAGPGQVCSYNAGVSATATCTNDQWVTAPLPASCP